MSPDTPKQTSLGAADGIALVSGDGTTKVVSAPDFIQALAATMWNGYPFSSESVFGGWWNSNPQPDAQGVFKVASEMQGLQSLNVYPQNGGGTPWTVTLNGKTYNVDAGQSFNPNWQNCLTGPVTLTASIPVGVNANGRFLIPGAVSWSRTDAYQYVSNFNQQIQDGQTITIAAPKAGDLLQYIYFQGQGHFTFNGYDIDTTNSGGSQLGGDNIGLYPLPVTVKFVATSAGQTANVSGNIYRKL